MKLKLLFAVLFPLTIVFASETRPYNNSKPPIVSLPIAYEEASAALGMATNQFHCVSANITTDFDPSGQWEFTFYSTNSKPKWVVVEFNGKVHIEDVMNR